jgi:S-disulfanyl-L-cysteine oxidoreductase SoxD
VIDWVKRAASVAAGLVVLVAAASTLQAQAPAATTNAGIYTEAQAERGKLAYTKNCQDCHGESLEGIDMAPALVGSSFQSNWVGLSVGELSERIRTTMPQNNPGTLSSATTADLIALILKLNGYPAGTSELPREAQVLQMIRIAEPKPAG